jgi:serine/threonine protein phosphatase 1
MDDRLFAIGDIHGCFDSFKELVENKIELKKEDKLILLGDYIDRGIQSKEVIDYIIELQQGGFDITPLQGNHEAMLLDAIKNEKHLYIWIANGGQATLNSFKIKSIKDIESIYTDFFNELPYFFAFREYLFVHGGFNDDDTNPFDDKELMLWESRKKYINPMLKDKIIVHGHRPVTVAECIENVRIKNNVINLDTGRVYSDVPGYGKLTALELNSRSLYFG